LQSYNFFGLILLSPHLFCLPCGIIRACGS